MTSRRPRATAVAVRALFATLSLSAACGKLDPDPQTAPDGSVGGGIGDAGPADAGDQPTGRGLTCVQLPVVTSCGGVACAELGGSGLDYCAATCCTDDDRCGARVAFQGRDPGPCLEQAQPDARCPSLEGVFGTVAGCCTADFECGVRFGLSCTPLRQLTTGGDTPEPTDCDGRPLVADDAGAELDAGR